MYHIKEDENPLCDSKMTNAKGLAHAMLSKRDYKHFLDIAPELCCKKCKGKMLTKKKKVKAC